MSTSSSYRLSARFFQIVDALLVLISFAAGALFRNQIIDFFGLEIPSKFVLDEMWWMLVIAVIVMPFALTKFNFYNGGLKKSFSRSFWQLIQAAMMLAGIIAACILFLKLSPSSRLAMSSSFVLMFVLILIRDRVWRNYRRRLAKKSKYRELVLFAGAGEDLERLLGEVPEEVKDYWEIVASFDFTQNELEELREMLDEHSVQRVVFAVKHTEFDRLSRAIEICEVQGVDVWVHAGFLKTQLARPDFDTLGGKPMLVLRSTPNLSWALFGKEVMDRVGAFIVLLFAFPFLLFAYIGIRLTSPESSPIFVQDRAGKFGRPFRMFKFRTMIPDAEAKLKEVKADVGNQMDGPVFKLDHDPRVFKFGSFLRKTSIDELPQLINVLLGDMSLVGPRPLPCYEVKEFQVAKHRRRLSVKPGITCTWQAGGRNSITSFEEWVDMDLAYIDSWSLRNDISILLKTIPAVLFSKGAK